MDTDFLLDKRHDVISDQKQKKFKPVWPKTLDHPSFSLPSSWLHEPPPDGREIVQAVRETK